MERHLNESPDGSAEQQSDDTAAGHLDMDLASAYAANSEMSLGIIEEFGAVDQEGF